MAKKLSATNLAVYHHLHCDLYLHNVYHAPKPASSGADISELSKAHFKRGNDWEKCLFSWLRENDLLLTIPSLPLNGDDLRENLICEERVHFFISNITIKPPKEIQRQLREAGTEPFDLSIAKPDLLEITKLNGGVFLWRVIDAKASSAVKTSHHVQIYFYTLCLSHILPEKYFRASGSAGVWLPPAGGFDNEPPSFDDVKIVKTSLLAPSLDKTFFKTIPNILSRATEDVQWHYNPNCRGCPYSSQCSTRAVENGEIGSMSNISLEEAKVLRSVLGAARRNSRPNSTDIQDLGQILESRSTMAKITKSLPMTVKKAKKILSLPVKERGGDVVRSPVLDAAMSGQIQIKPFMNFTCPKKEDIAVVLSLLQDPSLPGNKIVTYCITIFARAKVVINPNVYHGSGVDLVSTLAGIIRTVLQLGDTVTTQFYVFSVAEQTALQSHLIDAALVDTGDDDDVRLCIGALNQGASLLQTTYQPSLLSNTLLDFLTKGSRTRRELQECLQRLRLPTDGKVAEMRERLRAELTKGVTRDRRKELGQLPRVVVVKQEVDRLLALPIPGFWDLPECVGLLDQKTNSPSDEDIYEAFVNGADTDRMMEKRNLAIFAVLKGLRKQLKAAGQDLLVNSANVLTSDFMDLCREEHLRKLFFMQQFEVLSRLTDLWRARINGCPDAPILEFECTVQSSRDVEHKFKLVSGSLDMAGADRERAFYDFLLVEDKDSGIPTEALFDDLDVAGLVFPLNKWTKPKWDQQHRNVQDNLCVVDVREIIPDGRQTKVFIKTFGGRNVDFQPGEYYRISPRYVDFNVTKVLATLLEIDLQCMPDRLSGGIHVVHQPDVPFLQLILRPKSFGRNPSVATGQKDPREIGKEIQRRYRQLKDLDVPDTQPLMLMHSQSQAAMRVLSNRLSVIWGPPGTGKTHTIALSLLRLLEVQHLSGTPGRKIVFITAMTHAAIQACLKKLWYLMKCIRNIDKVHTNEHWLDTVAVEHVRKGRDHEGPSTENGTTVYAGTVYQLYNFSKQHNVSVDYLIIDEAGQLSLGSAALVCRSLSSTGKITIAGDSEQLAPIFAATYPQLRTAPLFGSILDCVMYWSKRPNDGYGDMTRPSTPEIISTQSSANTTEWSQETIVQLTENFRLNPDLGDFVSTIYSRAFKAQKFQARKLAAALKAIMDDFGKTFGLDAGVMDTVQWFLLALADVMFKQPQNILSPPPITYNKELLQENSEIEAAPHPVSLALIRLQTTTALKSEEVGYELHVKAEAAVAAALVTCLRRCSPDEDIFVATPHKIQRQAVNAALAMVREQDDDERTLVNALGNLQLAGDPQSGTARRGKVIVDTIERLQGDEAAFVICLFSMPQSTPAELGFLLQRRRLNVAISRAKTLCILVASQEVLRPSVNVLADEGNAKGYAFLRAFEDRAWSSTVEVNVDRL